ncbi:MAG TPA: arginine deiminase family protein [Gammaproteobacteria bacterium]|nr:arginine deiminase family protein [Gammaproteobacteria bacterium]
MRIAITRAISPALEHCELSFLTRDPIDLTLAAAQHRAYEQALAACGCTLRNLTAEPELPDSVFVEDTAIVLDEVAVITHPGAASRRPETASIAAVLREYRELVHIAAPATLDGGDVLRVGRVLYVGVSARSSRDGIAQLAQLLAPFGYTVSGVPLRGCLHLKSAVTRLAPDLLLINPDWVDADHFPGMKMLNVDSSEPHAANALLIGDSVIYPTSGPRTRAQLLQHGVRVLSVDMSETEKAEGGVTCCSLIFET